MERKNYIIKISIQPKAIYRQPNYNQDTSGVFHITKTSITKIIWNHNTPRIVTANPEKEEQNWSNQAT